MGGDVIRRFSLQTRAKSLYISKVQQNEIHPVEWTIMMTNALVTDMTSVLENRYLCFIHYSIHA